MPTWMRMAAAACLVVLGFAACDSGGGFDEAAYCEIAREFEGSDGLPSDEQLDRYVDAAPDEISEDAEWVADQIKESDGNLGALFGDEEVAQEFEERIANIEAAETERCGIEHGGDEDGEGDGEGEESDGEDAPAEGATVVPVSGVEYAFEGVPSEVAAGLTAFEFTNDGEEAHEMGIFKLAEGVTAEEVLNFEGDPEEEGLVSEVGFAFADPGGEDVSYVNADLEPGNYGMVCFVPGAGGEPHAALGMVAEFTVA